MYKKILSLILLSVSLPLFADEFLDNIQLIAFITACAGQYSTIQAGYDSNRKVGNYYTPEMYADGFKSMSGNRTSTQMFYGVCADYAFAAWNYIHQYKDYFVSIGMKKDGFFIVAVDEDNKINLFKPKLDEEKTKSNYVLNGIEMITIASYQVHPHENVTHHSWIWIQKNNDDWYWMDPTFSDNTGYIHCGQVINGEEIYLESNPKYTINNPKKILEPEEEPVYTEYNPRQNELDSFNNGFEEKYGTYIYDYDDQENRDGIFISVANFINKKGFSLPQNFQLDFLFAIDYSDYFYCGINIEYTYKIFDEQVFNQFASNAVLGVAYTFDFIQFYIDGNIGFYGCGNANEENNFCYEYGVKSKARAGISLLGDCTFFGIFYEYNFYFKEPAVIKNSKNQFLAHSVIGCALGIIF